MSPRRSANRRVKHALITGAAGAIGEALARALRTAHPDAHLSLIDIDETGLARVSAALTGPVHTHVADLSRPEQLNVRWAEWIAEPGPVTTLINCAGIMIVRSLAGTDWDAGRRTLDIDLIAPLRLMDMAVPEMLESGGGCIVNVTSMAGVTPLRGCSYYGAAKSGLSMASEIANLELRERGIHVLTVYPGPVESALERSARSGFGARTWTRHIPNGQPAKLAALIVAAMARRDDRVIYPKLYALAARIPTIASWFTRTFSPRPVE